MATEQEHQTPSSAGNNLLGLGVGGGSKVERIKAESCYLRGEIAEELAQDSTHREARRPLGGRRGAAGTGPGDRPS
ncbi:hypothetical protein [Thermogemmatispora sp.]|uniref:hypothetical protein n=1 Tax=Thermogemmatispora sp. TaxID=1968838 RepID=UPI0035E43B2A